MERPDAVAARARFLRQIKKLRENGYSVVYVDETWVNQNHCCQYTWLPQPKLLGIGASKEMLKLPNIPSGKGKRLIILHAGSAADGFIEGCELVFVGNKNSADYHGEIDRKSVV